MSKKVLGKIDKLIKKFSDPAFPEQLDEIKGWRTQVEIEMIKKDLKKNEGIQLIIDHLSEELKDIITILHYADSEKLPDKQRDRLLDRKELYRWFLDFFTNSDKIINSIEKEVDEQLEET